MRLYHYTAGAYLRAIGRHGLTVGDVPTDLAKWKGRVGVWLTDDADVTDHGLGGSALDKNRFRLAIEVPSSPVLVRWLDWAEANATPETRRALHSTVAPDAPTSWYVFFGVIKPTSIVECLDIEARSIVDNWADFWPKDMDRPGVPAYRREAWHKQLMKSLKASLG